MGHRLGERPADPRFVDENDVVDFVAYEQSKDFQEAIDWVVERTREGTVCLMAGKADPWDCHRHWLLAQALMSRGIPVLHVLGDGSREPASVDLLHWQAAQVLPPVDEIVALADAAAKAAATAGPGGVATAASTDGDED